VLITEATDIMHRRDHWKAGLYPMLFFLALQSGTAAAKQNDTPLAAPVTPPAAEPKEKALINALKQYTSLTTSFGLLAHTYRKRTFRLDSGMHVVEELGSKSDSWDAAVMVGFSAKLPLPGRPGWSIGLLWPTFVQTVSQRTDNEVAPLGLGIGAYYHPDTAVYSVHIGWMKTQERTLSTEAVTARSASTPLPAGAPLTREIGASSFFAAFGISP
jgi:hypothetical protein